MPETERERLVKLETQMQDLAGNGSSRIGSMEKRLGGVERKLDAQSRLIGIGIGIMLVLQVVAPVVLIKVLKAG